MNTQITFKTQTKNKSQRNSLVELMRFFFAVCVLLGHFVFPTWLGSWDPICHTPVECFFIISGWFFISSFSKGVAKYGQYGPFRSFWRLFKDKFASLFFPIIVPSFICLQIGSWYGVCNGGMSMLWFMHDLALVFMIMFLIYYRNVYRKNDIKRFNIILVIICGISTVLRFVTMPLWDFALPCCRAISTISFAMLFCQIPKFKGKKPLLIFLTIFLLILNILAQIAPIANVYLWVLQIRYAFAYLLFTPFLYFACQVSIRFKPFDYLGKISGPVYYYQGVNYLFLTIAIWSGNDIFKNIYFLIFMPIVFAIIDDGIRRLKNYICVYKNPKRLNQKSFEEHERLCAKFEQKKGSIWIIHVITILCISAYVGICGIASFTMYMIKAPGWENWWWLTPEGDFSTFGKIALLCLSGVFTPLFFSLNISLVLKGRKKYPLSNPTFKTI